MAKFTAKQLHSGEWAVFTGKSFFTSTVTAFENEARIAAAHRTALWHQAQMDKAEKEMRKLGAFDNGTDFGDWCS